MELDLFVENNIIGMAWADIGDLTKLSDNAGDLRSHFHARYPTVGEGAIPGYISMLRAFAYQIAVGDKVIYPSAKDGFVYFGSIAGHYKYDLQLSSVCPHLRPVAWTHRLLKSRLGAQEARVLATPLALFAIRNRNIERDIVTNGEHIH